MKIFLVKAGEPLPTDADHPRLLRTGMLFEFLGRHHEVTWLTEAFNHQHKTFRAEIDSTIEISPNKRIRLLRTIGYRGNISPRRMLDDLHFAWKCWREMRARPDLDLIVCAYPLVFTAFVCVAHARSRGVPVVVDVRDLWPDIFLLATRGFKKFLAGTLAVVLEPFARYTLRNATSVIGITDGIVDWACKKAKRVRQSQDTAFPLGFLPQGESEQDSQSAKAFWDSHGVHEESFVLAYVGQINNKVDLDTVVQGFLQAQLPPSARLVIAGTGEDAAQIRRLANQHPGIVFPGWINGFQLESLLRRTQVGLAPYRNRIDFQLSVPNKVIEYLFYGVPLAASIDGEIKNLIQKHDCGVLYEEGSPETFAKAVRTLFLNPQQQTNLSQNASHLYQNAFEGQAVFERFASHLQSLRIYSVGLRPSEHSV